jgi:DNA-binding winged helix-turn-helix (wHTH) protein
MLRFGDFTLDTQGFELRRLGRKVALQPKIVDLLIQLVANRDRVVTRAELFAAVWPGVRVGQASLNRAVRELRRALGDDDRSPRFVTTIPRRGYRFIAPIERAELVRAAPTAVQRDRGVQSTLVQVAAAQTWPELSSALDAASDIVDASGTILCAYTELGVALSGSHHNFVAAYTPELLADDVLHARALTFDFDTGIHRAMGIPDELRDKHHRTIAYNEFYRPLGVADVACMQLTPGKSGSPGCMVLLLAREYEYDDAELRPIAWLRDVFAAAVNRVGRVERESLLGSPLFDESGHARFSAWDLDGRLLWHSPRGSALLGVPRQLPAALHAALVAWCDVARGRLSASPPPPAVVFTNSARCAVLARLQISRLPTGDPVVLMDFEARVDQQMIMD